MRFLILFFFLFLSSHCYAFELPKDAEIQDHYPNGNIRSAMTVNPKDNSVTLYRFFEKGGIRDIGIITQDKHLNGPYTVFNEQGDVITEGHHLNDKENGIRKRYYDNGKLKLLEDFREGIQEGPMRGFYEDGKLLVEATYKNGKLDGQYKEFYENGQLKISCDYKNDLRDGVQLHYEENGNLMTKIEFKNGLADGEAIDYAFGTVINKCIYKKGKELECQKNDFSLPDSLKSIEGIAKINVDVAESFKSITSDWHNPDNLNEYSASKEKIIEFKQKNISIFGQDFTGEFRKRDDGSFDLLFNSFDETKNPEFYKTFMKRAVQMWGVPTHEKDNSYGTDFKYYQHDAQWVYPNIVIRFGFDGYGKGGSLNKGIYFLIFGSKKKNPEMTDQIILKCGVMSQTFGMDSNSQPQQRTDTVFIIDQDEKKILGIDHMKRADIVEIASDHIIANLPNDDKSSGVVTIDRLLGNFKLEIKSKQDSSIGENMWGDCKKIDQKDLTPKF